MGSPRPAGSSPGGMTRRPAKELSIPAGVIRPCSRTRPGRLRSTRPPDRGCRWVPRGTVQYGVPGVKFSGIGTIVCAPNVDRYTWLEVLGTNSSTLDQAAISVNIGPASDGHVRVGIYAANLDLQPTGAPLVDVEIAVA